MLVLSRRPGQIIDIGDDVSLMVLSARGGEVRLGITAPPEVVVDRREIRLLRNAERGKTKPPTEPTP